MADRVHPVNPAPEPTEDPEAPPSPNPETPKPKPGTYVIQIPKDQIYRIPPPENTHLYQTYTRRGPRRHRSCCCCLTRVLSVLFLLILALAITATVLYFVYKPKLPTYSIEKISIKNLTALSPKVNVTVRADNPNKKLGVSYRSGGDITMLYSGVTLCRGSWPVFYQGKKNVTRFQTDLNGTGIRLSSSLKNMLLNHERNGEVPLEINVKSPVRFKFGSVTSWTMNIKVRCDVVVNKLTDSPKIVLEKCKTKLDIWR